MLLLHIGFLPRLWKIAWSHPLFYWPRLCQPKCVSWCWTSSGSSCNTCIFPRPRRCFILSLNKQTTTAHPITSRANSCTPICGFSISSTLPSQNGVWSCGAPWSWRTPKPSWSSFLKAFKSLAWSYGRNCTRLQPPVTMSLYWSPTIPSQINTSRFWNRLSKTNIYPWLIAHRNCSLHVKTHWWWTRTFPNAF